MLSNRMRYIRQVIFEKIGENKQKLLENSTVSIIGIGAIGSITADLMARAGVNINLIDRDIVSLTNLQRQKLFNEDDIGNAKALVAKNKLSKINSSIKINYNIMDLDTDTVNKLKNSDLILDCTDNFETRYLINEFSIKEKIPWVYSAVIGSAGMIMNIIPDKTPCFKCIFKEPTALLGTCETDGILNTIPTLIASLQVTEAIKILTKQQYSKELIYYDIWTNKLIKHKLSKAINCTVCNKNFEYLTGEKTQDVLKFCGSDHYQIKGRTFDLEDVKKKLSKIGVVKDFGEFISFNELTIFKDRVLIKANSKEMAKSIYNKTLG